MKWMHGQDHARAVPDAYSDVQRFLRDVRFDDCVRASARGGRARRALPRVFALMALDLARDLGVAVVEVEPGRDGADALLVISGPWLLAQRLGDAVGALMVLQGRR